MNKYLPLLLFLFSVELSAQVDCTFTPERSLSGAVVLGDGTSGSVNTTMIQNALNAGGVIRINQGSSPSQINLTETLTVTKQAVIDGGGLVTLSGQNQRRLILIENPQNNQYVFTIQNISLTSGFTATESGAAIFKPSGGPWQAVSLEIVNVHIHNNHAIQVEQDGGGGGIYAVGMNDVLISHSVFEQNTGSNGGAIYSLGSKVVKITDSVFDGNEATGHSGNPGNGGNAGAIGIDGGERTVNICRSQISNNIGHAYGAGFFSVMYDQSSFTGFTDVSFLNNHNPEDFGLGGGAYIQGGPFTINRSSFIENEARGAGGLFFGPGANGEMVNSTLYGNVASNTLGGGMSVDNTSVLTLRHVTMVNNHAPCGVCFAGGIANGSGNQIAMYNSILMNNTGGNIYNPWNVRYPVAGSNNLQFPQIRPSNQSEVAATPDVIWADPLLESPAFNGGETLSMSSNISSPGVNQALVNESTPTDQRLKPRYLNPDIGAFELQADLIFQNGFE